MIALSLSHSFPLPLDFPLSTTTWRPSHELTLSFQKPFVWLGSRTDSIMSEGQEVKKPRVASCFALHAMVRMDTRRREGHLHKREIILQVNTVSFFFFFFFLGKLRKTVNMQTHVNYVHIEINSSRCLVFQEPSVGKQTVLPFITSYIHRVLT